MSRRVAVAGVALVLVATTALARWKFGRDAQLRAQQADAIRAVVDTTREAGWVETFDAARSQSLSGYDSRWRPIFGRLLVDRQLGAAIGDPEGGWERDGGDDYSFRSDTAALSSVEIVVDGWWDGQGSIGAEGAVQSQPPHQLYEATLWRGRLALIYFAGPTPDRFEILAESREPAVEKGFYRLTLAMERGPDGWHLRARLLDPAHQYRVLGEATASDTRLPPGAQGIGILGGGGRRSSYITGIAVRNGDKGGLAEAVRPRK
jgi:hypothetical protein